MQFKKKGNEGWEHVLCYPYFLGFLRISVLEMNKNNNKVYKQQQNKQTTNKNKLEIKQNETEYKVLNYFILYFSHNVSGFFSLTACLT